MTLLAVAALGAIFQVVIAIVDDNTSENPLNKVLTLLGEMKIQVEKDAEQDESAYKKYECWCKTNEKEKTAAIENADSNLEELNAFAGEAVAKDGQLKTEIATLEDDVAKDRDALEKATALRAKEKEAFEQEAADMNETLQALNEAVKVLSAVQFVQTRSGNIDMSVADQRIVTALTQVRQKVLQRHSKFSDVLQKDLFDVLGSFEDATPPLNSAAFLARDDEKPNDLSGAVAGAKSYNSRSGSILGVLAEMSDQFDRDLKQAQKEEEQALAAFEKLREAKEGEIAAATKQKKDKEAELADLAAKHSVAMRDIENLEAAKKSDQAFLKGLTQSCSDEAKQYEERVAVRSDEAKALGEAIQILTEDGARDIFGKTMSFLQLGSARSSSPARAAAQRAVARLASVARKHGSVSLASISTRLTLDGFEKVKEAMDKMVAELKRQQKDEDEKSELCKKDIDATEDSFKVAQQDAKDLDLKFTQVTNTLSTIDEEISQLQSDIAASEMSLKEAGEARKAENVAFQSAVSDQRATVNILNKALARLEAFYNPKDGALLVEIRSHRALRQEPGADVPPPPPKPSDYSKSAGAGGVLQLMRKIIKDAEVVEKELGMGEQKAQTDYAAFAKDAAASIETDRTAVAAREADRAENEGLKSETQEAQRAKSDELSNLDSLLKAHHNDCDWLLQYFDVRKQGRQEEMDAIADAKAILSGSDFGSE